MDEQSQRLVVASSLSRVTASLAAWLLLNLQPVQAQWGGDPAQSGTTVYCEAINGGSSSGEAEQSALQVMLQLLALGQGSLVIQQQVLPPSVQERWLTLIQARCPGADGAGGAGHDD